MFACDATLYTSVDNIRSLYGFHYHYFLALVVLRYTMCVIELPNPRKSYILEIFLSLFYTGISTQFNTEPSVSW